MASMMTVRVHPVVMLSMVDAHERRGPRQSKAMGTLLGWMDRRIIELTSAYSVPFSEEGDNPQLDTAYNSDMYDLYRRSGSEMPMGWFSTSAEVVEYAINYHDYYTEFSRIKQEKRDAVPVILLTLDAELRRGRMELKAYLRSKAGIPTAPTPHCALFIPLSVELAMFGPEETGLELIAKGMASNTRQTHLQTGLAQLKSSTDSMLTWIGELESYVDDVLAGKREGDPKIGRGLMALVTSAGKMPANQCEEFLTSSVKDYLMVSYLSQLANTQLSLHEKILAV